MQSQDMNIVEFQSHVLAELLGIPEVPLLGIRRLEIGIKHSPARKWQRIGKRPWNCRWWGIDTQVVAIVEECRVDFRICLLLCEKRHVQKRLVEVNAIAAPEN